MVPSCSLSVSTVHAAPHPPCCEQAQCATALPPTSKPYRQWHQQQSSHTVQASLELPETIISDQSACRLVASICANALPKRRLTRHEQTANLQACVVLGVLRRRGTEGARYIAGCRDAIGFKEWRLARVIHEVLAMDAMDTNQNSVAGLASVFAFPSVSEWVLASRSDTGYHRWWHNSHSLVRPSCCIRCGCELYSHRLQQLCLNCLSRCVHQLSTLSQVVPDYSDKDFWQARHRAEVPHLTPSFCNADYTPRVPTRALTLAL